MAGDSVNSVYCVTESSPGSTGGSKLTFLTSGDGHGKIKFVHGGAIKSKSLMAAGGLGTPTGIVIPLHGATLNDLGGTDLSPTSTNIIGDPHVADYSLTSGDFFTAGGAEQKGGAQKFVTAVLAGAYRAYTAGVSQGSGITSMTVSRGDLSLSATAVSDGTGIVNTYTRSYTVNFKYYQSGAITAPDNGTAARPDLATDGSDGVPF